MNKSEFMDKICLYIRDRLSAKCSKNSIKGILGFVSVGIGRKAIEKKLLPYIDMCSDENGNIDLPGLKESSISALDSAGSIPILYDLISIDAGDVKEFFDMIGC